MQRLSITLLTCLAASAQTHQFLREIRVDKNSRLTAPAVEPGAVLNDQLIRTLTNTEKELLKQDGYRDPKVEPEVIRVGSEQVDLHLRSEPGLRYVVNQVHFSGDTGVAPTELAHALHATRVHRGWNLFLISHPPFSDSAVAEDIGRLRSFYYSRGYFDAVVRPGPTEFSSNRAALTFEVNAGRRYDPATPIPEICRCLLDARHHAEREGKLDFKAQIELPAALWQIQAGEPFQVGRIEFTGNHHFSDKSVRRALVLEEGALFDSGRLRQSLARINQLGFFDPVGAEQVQVTRHPDRQSADVTIALVERKKGRWSISGPVGPPSVAGPLEGKVSMRLPASIYFGSVTWMAFNPIAKFLPFVARNPLMPIFALERPLLPGQSWSTGFDISPQIGWQGMLANYAVTHALPVARRALGLSRPVTPELAVPVEGRPGYLLCKPPKPRVWWARNAAGMGLDFISRSYLFGAR